YARHATRSDGGLRARPEEKARRLVGRAAEPLQGSRQPPADHRRLERVRAHAAPRQPHAPAAARADDPARGADDALGLRMGAAPRHGAQERRAGRADRRARRLARLRAVRRAREGGARPRRGGNGRKRGRRGLCRSRAAFRQPRPRRALRHRGLLRDGRPRARCAARGARARVRRALAEAAAIMSTPQRSYRYYDFVMAAFVAVLLCSNFIGAAKQASVTLPLLGQVTFGAGVLFFPISYIFGDILTEVYGYGRDRRVVWAGFGALAFASLMAWVVISLPAARTDFMAKYQGELE